MPKNKKKQRELEAQRAQIKLEATNLREEVAKRENKWTPEDIEKMKGFENEMRSISFDLMMLQTEGLTTEARENPKAAFGNMVREIMENKTNREVIMQREWTNGMDTTGVANLVPLTIKDVVEPLEQGLILSKVGIPLQTGLAGNYVWPVLGTVEANIANEKDVLADSKVNIDKLQPEPVRIGITIPVTYQAINQSNTLVYDIVKQQVSMAVSRAINRAMFCTEQFNAKFSGPFSKANKKGTFAGKIPTYAELLQMKAEVMKSGVNAEGACYVMSETLKAQLEATPIDKGSGRMIVENGKIAGYPIFCTNYINMTKAGLTTEDENVGFGVFAYQPLGQFGNLRMVIDGVTMAAQDCVRITVNGDWATVTLRAEAFGWMKCGKAV